MHATVPLSLAAIVAIAVFTIGSFYILAPQRVTGSFGLKLPAPDADTRAWLRLKGIRDIGLGAVVLLLMVTTDHRTLGLVLLVLAVVPFGDMVNVAASGGRRMAAFAIHGLTCVVLVLAGILLIRAF